MSKRKTNEEFIIEANKIFHNKYDYSLIDYKNEKSKLKIICNNPEHKGFIFIKEARVHLRGSGCPKCNNLVFDLQSFIEKSKKIHGDQFNYDKVEYKNTRSKIKLYCNYCNMWFEQRMSANLEGEGCPFCKISKGERKIELYLKEHKISFEYQKKFKNLKNIRQLSYDFYLPKENLLIEYNGEQHYKESRFKYHNLENQILNDDIKKDFAKNNNINLLVIPYWNFNNIENILQEELCQYTPIV